MKTLHVEINENSQKIKGGGVLTISSYLTYKLPWSTKLDIEKAMRQAFYSLFRYADYLINIFRNINENIVKSEKITHI